MIAGGEGLIADRSYFGFENGDGVGGFDVGDGDGDA